MSVKRVAPEEALDLIEKQGWLYVDVRSVPEFESGHPRGAYNVPLLHAGPRGMAPNPRFLAVMQRRFSPDAKIVVGCRSGGRSLQAAMFLQQAGYANVIDQRCGFHGAGAEAGWGPRGLPTSQAAEAGRSYAELEAETG